MTNIVIISHPRNYAPRVLRVSPVTRETATTYTVTFSKTRKVVFNKETGAAKGEDKGRLSFLTADEFIVSTYMPRLL